MGQRRVVADARWLGVGTAEANRNMRWGRALKVGDGDTSGSRGREERQSIQERRSGRHTDIQQSGPLARAPIRRDSTCTHTWRQRHSRRTRD